MKFQSPLYLRSDSGPEFLRQIDAKLVIEDWCLHYNDVRPHSSLRPMTPSEFKQ